MTEARSPLLSTRDLSVGYLEVTQPILSKLNLQIEAGSLVCILGANGSGKSTLLRTLAGLQKALGGELTLDGEQAALFSPRSWAKKVSIVLTEQMEVGNLTVTQLVALGRHPFTNWIGMFREHDHKIISQSLHDAGAAELKDRMYDELSDGEKQRVLLARALAQEPKLLLLDEPTAFLDLPRRVEMMHTLRKLAHDSGRAVLLSTHDIDLAMRMADKLWLITIHGNVISGLPEELALRGELQKVFSNKLTCFDLETGQFRMDHLVRGSFSLVGSSPLKFWTQRVMEREGFSVSANSNLTSIGRIEVYQSETGPAWKWEVAGVVKTIHSFEALVQALRFN